MGIVDRLANPDGLPVFLGMYPNGWSDCIGCKADIEEAEVVNARRQELIQSLGEFCHRGLNNKGDSYVPSYDVASAGKISEVMEAADEYDTAVQLLADNRRICTGAQGFTREGVDFVYCPRLDTEFPAQQ